MVKTAFAIAAHPDDIEFDMAGTLLLLAHAGYDIHYMNVANGSCGTATIDKDQIIAMRTQESRDAAEFLGATIHPPLVDDLMIYYTPELVARLTAVVRRVSPEILLVPSPQDYMEDHTNTSRLAVTAAFCRSLRNLETDPHVDPIQNDTAIYHAMPYGLQDQLRQPITAHIYVDVTSLMDAKRTALACHRSQKEWLDASQGLNDYIITMENLNRRVGKMSGKFEFAEGWRRHSHMGYADEDFDPLTKTLSNACYCPR